MARNTLVVILDSLRYDTGVQAAPEVLVREAGQALRRHVYGTWTLPSHQALFSGLLPYQQALPGEPAAGVYRTSYRELEALLRLTPGSLAEALLPHYRLPRALAQLGMRTGAVLSMPCLDPQGPAGTYGWTICKGTLQPNWLEGAMDKVTWEGGPWLWVVNTGETHYPYRLHCDPVDGEIASLPHVSGLRGALRALGQEEESWPRWDLQKLQRLHSRQRDALHRLGPDLEAIFAALPPGTAVVVTSDHGELFGESGLFGHGPFPHEKLLEVPFWTFVT